MSLRLGNKFCVLTVSRDVKSFKARRRTHAMSRGPPFAAQINSRLPFIYSCIIMAANCFVNGTEPLSPSCKYAVTDDVNNPFVCPTGRLAARFPWFNYRGLGSGENEGRTSKPPMLMTFKLITATCCHGVAHSKSEGNEKRSSPLWWA